MNILPYVEPHCHLFTSLSVDVCAGCREEREREMRKTSGLVKQKLIIHSFVLPDRRRGENHLLTLDWQIWIECLVHGHTDRNLFYSCVRRTRVDRSTSCHHPQGFVDSLNVCLGSCWWKENKLRRIIDPEKSLDNADAVFHSRADSFFWRTGV